GPAHFKAHRFEPLHDVGIRKAEHTNTMPRQVRSARSVVVLCGIGEVTIPVELDHKLVTGTIKVCDVGAERFLTGELLRQVTQKLEPELPLRRRRIPAQRARPGSKLSRPVGDVTTGHSRSTPLARIGAQKSQPPARLRLASPLVRGATR